MSCVGLGEKKDGNQTTMFMHSVVPLVQYDRAANTVVTTLTVHSLPTTATAHSQVVHR